MKKNSIAIACVSNWHDEWLSVDNAGNVGYEASIKNRVDFCAIFYGFLREATDRCTVRRSYWVIHLLNRQSLEDVHAFDENVTQNLLDLIEFWLTND